MHMGDEIQFARYFRGDLTTWGVIRFLLLRFWVAKREERRFRQNRPADGAERGGDFGADDGPF